MTAGTRKFWPPRGKERPQERANFRACDHPGCREPGEHRAPRSRETLTDYYWFCLDHVREYNRAWDYYAGLSADEIEEVVRFDTTWQRPTWPLGRMSGGRWKLAPERVKDPFGVFDEDMWESAKERQMRERQAHSPEEQALKLMELQRPITVESIRARYKELCKLHHPDANNGDKDAEERFKLIGQAYKILMESLNPTS